MEIVAQLAVILVAAGVFTVISKALKQPLILGYIVAGFIVGPSLGLFPQFDSESVHTWSEIGIIFLLFGLGLEFSFRKLLKVGMSAILMAGIQCAGMFVVGIILGDALGWTMMESLFLGGMLSMSSTSIIIKVFTEMGLKNKPYAGMIFGSLVVLDLIAVVMMVLLSTLAVSNKFDGMEMIMAIVKLVFFLVLWFLVGIYVIPTLLKKAKNYMTDEILLVGSIGLCFLMVTLATEAGFSSALGAFVMGSILSETVEGEHIAKITTPLKDLFGAVFFVSVGMLIDPAVIAENWLIILIITLTAMIGILIFASSGALLAGQGLDNAVHSGFSLAQLGEFSYILASLGCSLGVMRGFIYPVIVAVSVITTFTTPYMIKAGDPAYRWLVKILPPKVLEKLNPPLAEDKKVSKAEKNEWSALLKNVALRLGLYGVLSVAILGISHYYLPGIVLKLLPTVSEVARDWLCALITVAVMIPSLYGIAVNGTVAKESAARLVKNNPVNRWPVIGIIMLRLFISAGLALLAILNHVELEWWASLLILLLVVVYLIMARGSVRRINRFEERFISNLNSKAEMEKKNAPVASKLHARMAGYDVHLKVETVSSDFEYAGKTLREMPFRKNTGVNIVKITRGMRDILTPSGDEPIYPGDKLLAVGTNKQLEAFSKVMQEATATEASNSEEFELQMLEVGSESQLAGKTLRESKLRSLGCTVISVVHGGAKITNPEPDYRIEEGDWVWIAGEKSSLEWLK